MSIAVALACSDYRYCSAGPVFPAGTTVPLTTYLDLIYGPGSGVYVGYVNGSTAGVYSTDYGLTWTAMTLSAAGDWKNLGYTNGIWCLIAGNNSISNVVSTSPDGHTWTAHTIPTSAFWYGFGADNGIFVALAYTSTTAYTSPDGAAWTARTLPASNNWRGAAFGNGVWVAVSDNTATCARSTNNGASWANGGSTGFTPNYHITFMKGLFYVFHPTTSAFATSPDGVTWTGRTLPTTASFRRKPVLVNGVIVVTDNAVAAPLISIDGLIFKVSANVLPSAGAWIMAGGDGAIVGLKTTTTTVTQGLCPAAIQPSQ